MAPFRREAAPWRRPSQSATDCAMEGAVDDLIDAAGSGDTATIRSLLGLGADVNAISYAHGATALQSAARGGYEVAVEVLLQAGADDELTTLDEPRTALELAGYYGHTHCMWLLFRSRVARGLKGTARLRLGAELMLKSADVVYAARSGDYRGIRETLDDNAAYAHAMDKKTGETAFSAALAQGRKKMCELLLQYGAYAVGVCVTPSVGLINRSKHDSPVRHVTKKWDLPLLQWLLSKGANPHVRAVDDTCSALAWAVYHGRTPFVDLLLSSGAELSASQCTWIPLPITIRWILNCPRGDEEDPRPMSYLMLAVACLGRCEALVRYLFETRADLRDRRLMDEHGPLSLHMAVHQGSEAIVTELLEHGAPVNGSVMVASVALEAAVRVDSVSMVRLLVTHGADTALIPSLINEVAQFRAVLCAQELLRIDPTAVSTRSIATAVYNGDTAMLALFLRYHAEPLPDEDAAGLVEKAAEHGDYEMLELLLNHSTQLSAETMQRALIAACLRGKHDAARVLLSHGAQITHDVNAPGSREPMLHLMVAQADESDAVVDTLVLVLGNVTEPVTSTDVTGSELAHHVSQRLERAQSTVARIRLARIKERVEATFEGGTPGSV